ncbi:chymotrypsin-like protease CTRL-1 [Vanessa cardui]|uniref:chymotrypsin-like protease CTRL-1 n=1 Tax=Vanessa cardui TaxID=171605 RepID=UPI001F13B258|nr:chymotrypsin-like protease CTRL-1 [Vanessa cardui]
MKAFGFALLCVFAAVQGRSTGVGSFSTPAQNGENPWLVHLRVATSTGQGLLKTCVGSIIDASWVLTSASCLNDARFIWVRYGAADVIRPELVTESTTVRLNPDYDEATGANDVALINLNRVLENTDNISPIALAESDEVPASGKLCGYGAVDGAPGEQLSCFNVDLEANEDGSIVGSSEDGEATEFDLGAPLVSEGVQVGVLTAVAEGSSVFLNTAKYNDWISEVISQ